MTKGFILSAILENVRQHKDNVAFLKARTSDAFYDVTYFGDASDLEVGQHYVFELSKPDLYNGRVSFVANSYELIEGGE